MSYIFNESERLQLIQAIKLSSGLLIETNGSGEIEKLTAKGIEGTNVET